MREKASGQPHGNHNQPSRNAARRATMCSNLTTSQQSQKHLPDIHAVAQPNTAEPERTRKMHRPALIHRSLYWSIADAQPHELEVNGRFAYVVVLAWISEVWVHGYCRPVVRRRYDVYTWIAKHKLKLKHQREEEEEKKKLYIRINHSD